MKKTIISSAAALVLGVASIAASAQSVVVAPLTPSVSVISNSATSSFSGNGGGSNITAAGNFGTASSSGVAGVVSTGNAGLGGAVGVGQSANISGAANYSTGNANGTAQAAGLSQTKESFSGASGVASLQGNVSGNVDTVVGSKVIAGNNSAGAAGGVAQGGFLAVAGGYDNGGSVGGGTLAVTGTHTDGFQVSTGANVITTLDTQAAANAAAHINVGNQSAFSTN